MRNEIITFVSPKAQISEVFRTLRTNIQFMNVDGKLKSLLITSTVPGEGKSWVSSNLAVTFAQAGKKVLLVDADMRKGRQHEIFECKNSSGLSNYLVLTTKSNELESIGEYIQTTVVDNLYLMSSGTVPPNPSELLTSQKMVDLIKYLEGIFDIVIFDGTPSTIVTDAIILSKFVDSTLIVSEHKVTKIDDINQVKRNITNVGGKIAGVIVNKMPTTKLRNKANYYYERAIVPTKRNKLFSNIIKSKKVEENQIVEVKKKLQQVQGSNNNVLDDKSGAEKDVDINVVLEQLSQYLNKK